MVLAEALVRKHETYRVAVEQYKVFRRDGFLHIPGLVAQDEVAELVRFTDDMMAGRRTLPGIPAPEDDLSDADRRRFYERIHMPHRSLELAERFLAASVHC